MDTPRISIIIPALNEEKFLPHLLESLIQQTDKDFEVIVVDGKSKDKTVEKAKEFGKKLKGLKVIAAEHAGLPYQRNLGVTHSKGEYLVFSDADNILMPYAVDRIKTFILTTHPEFFASWCQPDSDIPNDAMLSIFANLWVEGSIIFKRPFTPGPLTMVARNVCTAIGGYTEGLSWGEDMDFSNKASKAGYRFSVLREVLYVWSMRRLRNEGSLKFIQQAVKASFYVLFTNKALTHMKGYDMGGHLYKKRKKPNPSVLNRLSVDIKKLMREVFE